MKQPKIGARPPTPDPRDELVKLACAGCSDATRKLLEELENDQVLLERMKNVAQPFRRIEIGELRSVCFAKIIRAIRQVLSKLSEQNYDWFRSQIASVSWIEQRMLDLLRAQSKIDRDHGVEKLDQYVELTQIASSHRSVLDDLEQREVCLIAARVRDGLMSREYLLQYLGIDPESIEFTRGNATRFVRALTEVAALS